MAHEGVDEVSWTSLLLLTLITLTGLFSFLILNLNPAIVYVDLLFYEVDISLGLLLLLFFLFGFFITLILEITYFLRKKAKKDG